VLFEKRRARNEGQPGREKRTKTTRHYLKIQARAVWGAEEEGGRKKDIQGKKERRRVPNMILKRTEKKNM